MSDGICGKSAAPYVLIPRPLFNHNKVLGASDVPRWSKAIFFEWPSAFGWNLWYNICAFSEEDVGLRNRAGEPSEMMLI